MGLLPQEAPLVCEACGVSERAYQDWKGAIDQLWCATYRRQQHLDKSAADERREATRRDKYIAHERQEAACRQRLHDKHAAHK